MVMLFAVLPIYPEVKSMCRGAVAMHFTVDAVDARSNLDIDSAWFPAEAWDARVLVFPGMLPPKKRHNFLFGDSNLS